MNNVFVVAGPSGAGKGTLVKGALARDPTLRLAISWTTREPKNGEVDGVDYHFTSLENFEQMKKEGKFAECANVFGKWYGTPIEELEREDDRALIVEIDVQGAFQLKSKFPDAQMIFVLPPSPESLEHRMRKRKRGESEEEVARRLAAAPDEIQAASQFDCWILNSDPNLAVAELVGFISLKHFGVKMMPSCYRDERILREVSARFMVAV